MHNSAVIARKELKHYFITPTGYIILSLFAILTGWLFFHHVNYFNYLVTHYQMSQRPDVLNEINLNRFVIARLFDDILLLMVFFLPALTMRLIAEEKKQKTLELMLSSAVTTKEIVAGKYLSVLMFLALMLGLTWVYPAVLFIYGSPGPDIVPIITGYAGLFLVGGCVLSVGIFASSITENQIVAFILAVFISYLFYVISLPASTIGGFLGELLRYLSLKDNFGGFARAFISTRVLIYYISFTFIWLLFTHRVIEGLRIR